MAPMVISQQDVRETHDRSIAKNDGGPARLASIRTPVTEGCVGRCFVGSDEGERSQMVLGLPALVVGPRFLPRGKRVRTNHAPKRLLREPCPSVRMK